MFVYPLRFKVNGMDAQAPVTVIDKNKTVILARPKLSKEMETGKASIPVQWGSEKMAFQITNKSEGDLTLHTIAQANGKKLATLKELKGHRWSLLNAQDAEIVQIKEKMAVKRSCLFTLITSKDMEEWLKLLFAHGFKVYKNGKQVLWLREIKDTISWDYVCRKKEGLEEEEESLILMALTCMPFTVS